MLTRTFAQPGNQFVSKQFAAEINRLFDALLNQTPGRRPLPATLSGPLPARGAFPSEGLFPPINIWEDDAQITLEVEVPGMTMDDLELLIKGEQITLRGERGRSEQQAQCDSSQEGSFVRRERWSGRFERTLSLPIPVDQEQAQATLQNGVLTVVLPKAPSARPRKIEIRPSSTAYARDVGGGKDAKQRKD